MDNGNFENVTDNRSTSEKLYSMLLRCSHALSRGHHHEKGMHPGQWRILSFLAAHGPITQHSLLDTAQVRAASLSELLSKLEGKELIIRTKEQEDKRNVLIEITELGKNAVAENAHSRRKMADELFAVLSDEEKEQLILLLGKLNETWREKRESEEHGSELDGGCFHSHENDGEHGSHNHGHRHMRRHKEKDLT